MPLTAATGGGTGAAGTTTTEQLFAWIGCIIVNVAFLMFIGWGAATADAHWWIGFVVSIFYTAILLALAQLLDTEEETPDIDRFNNNESTGGGNGTVAATEEEEGDDAPTTTMTTQRPNNLLVTVLYGLAVLSLGVTGSFLTVHAIRCSTSPYYDPYNDNGPSTIEPKWTTNVTLLPVEVGKWAQTVPSETGQPSATFIYLPGSNTLLFDEWNDGFAGSFDVMVKPLWSVINNHGPPVMLHLFAGHEFVLINAHETCFTTTTTMDRPSMRDAMACTDGRQMRFVVSSKLPPPVSSSSSSSSSSMSLRRGGETTTTTTITTSHTNPRNLMVDATGMVWYKDDPPGPFDADDPYDVVASNDWLVFSLDPATMIETLHSQHIDHQHNDDNNDNRHHGGPSRSLTPYQSCRRTKATASLFLAALPITLSSLYLWYRRHVPSMGLTTFIGLYVTVGCLVGIVAPSKLDDINILFNWSNLCLGALWIIFTTNGILSLSLQQNKAAPMRWGLNIGSLAYFIGGIAVVGLFDGNNANWPPMTASVRWILFNAAIVAPLCLLGLTTQSSFLLVLTAISVLLDAFRLCHVWTRSHQDDDTFVALVYFLVLGGTGISTAVMGWWLSRQQQALAARLSSFVAPYAWSPARWHESTTPMFTALPTGDIQQEAPPTATADEETTQR